MVVEVHPAAALRRWGLPYRRYKGSANTAVRHQLIDLLSAQAPWLRLGQFDRDCRRCDHAVDAVIAGLNARAAAVGRATLPPAEHAATAQTEGWIALPTTGLADLTHDQPGQPPRPHPTG